jgi:hypothetical protein
MISELTSQFTQIQARQVAGEMGVAVLKKGLDVQKSLGAAAVMLIENAAVPVEPDKGANVDLYV